MGMRGPGGHRWRVAATIAVTLAAATTLAGCGGGAGGSDGGVPVIRWTTDRDPLGVLDKQVKWCNEHAAGKWKIEPVIMPPTVDAKREQITRRLAAKDDGLDILSIDVVWTAEFSQAGWIVDLTERLKPREAEYVPAAIETVRYEDKLWAMPMNVNVAMLYYRTDIIKRPPDTWEELVKMSKEAQQKHPDMYGLLFQANQYEGLTVDALEFITSAGGNVLDESGKKAIITRGDSATFALGFMRSLVADGITPRAVVTFTEEESRQAFQQGKAVFLRNWPYVYPLANDKASSVAGKFDVAPLPGFEGRQRSGILGGANLAISAYSPHPEEAWEAMDCLAGEEWQRRRAIARGELPVLDRLYQDPEVKKAMPYVETARTALETALPRPVTPYYNDVTRAIYVNSNEAIAGVASPEEAAETMHGSVQRAISGNADI